ncbi:MAG: hypothetical protein ACREMY_30855, partial [bacterium]
LYVAAQALERLMEPVAGLVLTTTAEGKNVEDKLKKAKDALEKKDTAAAEKAIQDAADAQGRKDSKRSGRAFFYWALGTTLAFFASGGLGLYIVRLIDWRRYETLARSDYSDREGEKCR